ncbi:MULTISPECIES: hypothetical protein [unclassified Arthrobacter]|uniref:hypothetical protein n=1 Tax=unclassified Arthrobacter TaxID=235627 RepID=UPI00159D7749|nr:MULTISPECIES: hypothetical protein [unclassified Arthrobacter]MCQ9163045.1 hypothetical protein [Arthrobacter sp. STN4]NVM97501.1 hypothetical protein [Arthrobacter sp. SDTb3-6]
MRWDALFGDLDAQWHAATQQELEREVDELSRIEASQATLADALRGSLGGGIAAVLRDGVVHHGTLQRVEEQWLLLGTGRLSVVLPLAKLMQVRGLGPARVARQGRVGYTLASALRILARNRAAVVLGLEAAQPAGVHGVLEQVGADFVVVTPLADGVARGGGRRKDAVVVALDALMSVTSSGENEF